MIHLATNVTKHNSEAKWLEEVLYYKGKQYISSSGPEDRYHAKHLSVSLAELNYILNSQI